MKHVPPPLPSALALALGVALWSSQSCAQLPGAPPPRSWFALDVESGVMLPIGDWTPYFHVRTRAGYSYIRNWKLFDVTLTAEHITIDRTAFGVMASIASIEQGWSVLAGATVSLQGNPGITIAAGYSLFQIEAQVLFDQETQVWIGAGIRVPLGAFAYSIWAPPTQYRMPAQPRP